MQASVDIAKHFFSRYNAHDLQGMLACFSPEGRVDYLPIGLEGTVDVAGLEIWGALIDAFPDLNNQVTAHYIDEHAQTIVVEVTIRGTQAKDAFGIGNLGRSFELPHVFILGLTDDGLILAMKAYWDNVTWYQALGKKQIG
ncbi:nuclear transport factor 2 family protein [Pseudomonas asiatica]|uniref:Nuclear transport factor 2 family protein n=1 Tax=Pseudomonas asiatica TaxID=2219225 RepID=A0ABU5KSW3_9PSED|nr:nuclear transport factor 2 family protein [Pseudomonas asiatica]MDZ5737030.1 nuclear transport factor 2 family protein [Pseudomonas asiatica]MDZ5742292.1 nuclear transport factor 2 family protein [Pseudomonas asiatica]MDZ5747260.1 nuclear transport factor 2 family protein [Pseudomonas asiatica]MDZ5752376.1 nuclear transport factor 2 family protein [Pseudomonas asiatica]